MPTMQIAVSLACVVTPGTPHAEPAGIHPRVDGDVPVEEAGVTQMVRPQRVDVSVAPVVLGDLELVAIPGLGIDGAGARR